MCTRTAVRMARRHGVRPPPAGGLPRCDLRQSDVKRLPIGPRASTMQRIFIRQRQHSFYSLVSPLYTCTHSYLSGAESAHCRTDGAMRILVPLF